MDIKTPCQIHVVSHTHWDREWRYALQRSKNKLVGCMDKVLETLENDQAYKHFMCDGQTIMVLDYLDYRPENLERVKKLGRAGKLVLGPWYSLIDEYNSGGEAVVRNLLWGHKTADELGGCMDVGYCPASFGHISQMPQILAGFGHDTVMYSRGLTSAEIPDMEYIWEGSDGTQLLGVHMLEEWTKSNFTFAIFRPSLNGMMTESGPQIGAMNGIPFHVCDRETAKWAFFHELSPKYSIKTDVIYDNHLKLKQMMLERCRIPVMLYLDGVDQMEANPLVPQMVAEIQKRDQCGDQIVHSSLPAFFAAVKEYFKKNKHNLQVLKGECCYPFKRNAGNGNYLSVNSARMYQHIENEKAEVLLEKWAEPLATFAQMEGGEYPLRPLEAAWKDLFANHTHDCIAGCSADQVHENVMYRYAQIKETAADLLERSLQQLSLRVDLSGVKDNEIPVIFYNPQPFARSEVADFAMDLPNTAWVEDFSFWDGDKELPFQTTTRTEQWKLLIKWGDVSTGVPMQRFFVSLKVDDIPSMGYKTVVCRYQFGNRPGGHVYKDKLSRKFPGSLAPRPGVLENEFLRLEFNGNGSFNLLDKERNRWYRDQHYFTDAGELGDIWSSITPGHTLGTVNTLGSAARFELLRDGPMEAAYKVESELSLPTHGIREDRVRRADTRAPFAISSEIIIKKGARRVDIVTTFTNNIKDHLLRAVFPTDLKIDHSFAEGQFDVIQRPIEHPHRPDWWEPWPVNYTNAGFVDASDGKHGLAVVNEGVNAYQIEAQERRPITLTLLRATMCPVSNSPDEDGAQCLRKHVIRYGVYPHAGDWRQGRVFHQARAHNVGLRVVETGKHAGELPPTLSFIKVEPDELVFSALKPSEDGKACILRLWNPTDELVKSKLTFYRKLKSAALANMLEVPQEQLKLQDQGQAVSISLPNKKILTLRFEI